jgi:hypothetical protein
VVAVQVLHYFPVTAAVNKAAAELKVDMLV